LINGKPVDSLAAFVPIEEEQDAILILLDRKTGLLQLIYEGVNRNPIEIEAIIETAKLAYRDQSKKQNSVEKESDGFLN
jgi:hypothetical protein